MLYAWANSAQVRGHSDVNFPIGAGFRVLRLRRRVV